MSPTENGARQALTDERTSLIGKIVEIMRESWDTPADCNDGELFTYAEVLFDRIEAGDAKDALERYLEGVQTGKLGMPDSRAHNEIVERSLALMRELREARRGRASSIEAVRPEPHCGVFPHR